MFEVTLFLAFTCLGGLVHVRGQVNVALGKPVYQSSRNPNAYAIPTHATDGFLSGTWNHRRCTATANPSENPWLVVDLLEEVTVSEVRIQHRADCCENDFVNVGVAVGNDFDVAHQAIFNPRDMQQCTLLASSTGRGTRQTAMCDAPVRGRYVALYITSLRTYISVCEVEVTGSETSLVDVSTGKPTFASSTHNNYYASLATDGNHDGLFTNKHGFHSAKHYRPWLAIELGQSYQVKFVTIKNREDAGRERLNQVYVGTSRRMRLDPASPFVELSYWNICAFFPGDYYAGEILAAECNPVRQARYVVVFFESNEFIMITEVVVYAYE